MSGMGWPRRGREGQVKMPGICAPLAMSSILCPSSRGQCEDRRHRRHRPLKSLGRRERDPKFQGNCACEGSKPSQDQASEARLQATGGGRLPGCAPARHQNLGHIVQCPQTQTSSAMASVLPTMPHSLQGPPLLASPHQNVCPSVCHDVTGGPRIPFHWGEIGSH